MRAFCVFLSKRKIIKKGWKIVLIPLTVLFLSLTGLYLAIQSQEVQHFLTRKTTAILSKRMNINLHVEGVKFALFNKIILQHVWIEDQQSDTLAYVRQVVAKIDEIRLCKKKIGINQIILDHSVFNISRDSTGVFNFNFLTQSSKPDTQGEWSFTCNNFRLKNSGFVYIAKGEKITEYGVDDINLRVDDFHYQPDSLGFRIASLTLTDRKGFILNDLSATVVSDSGKFTVDNLSFETLNSKVNSASLMFYSEKLPGAEESRPKFELSLEKARLSLADVAHFVPSIAGMNQVLEIDGHFSGSQGNLRAKDLVIKTGDYTRAECDISVDFIEGISEPFLFIDLNLLRTDFRDLARIRLPKQSKFSFLMFPEQLVQSGLITYEGNFTGFLSDFVAYGTLKSQMGKIKTDLSFVPVDDNNIRYKGILGTSDFALGQLIRSDRVGEISFQGMVNGIYNKTRKNITGNFDGTVSKLAANGYVFQHISLNGNLSNRKFDGNLVVDDPNLALNFTGLLNLDSKVPIFDFVLNLPYANLVALNLDSLNTRSELAFGMTANFSGNNIDNFDGLIQVYNGKYTNQNNGLEFENLTVNTHLDEKISRIDLNSDYFDGSITGTYHFNSLIESFRIVLARYLPSLSIPVTETGNSNQFSFKFFARELNELTAVFIPGLQIKTPFSLTGSIDSQNGALETEGAIPEVIYNQIAFRNISVRVTPVPGALSSKIRFGEVRHLNGLNLHNLAFLMDAKNDQIKSRIVWNNWEKLSYSGEILSDFNFARNDSTGKPFVDIKMKPSGIIIADTVWKLAPASIRIDNREITVNGFSFKNGEQEFRLNGKIAPESSERLSLVFRNIDLARLEQYLNKPLAISGLINGNIGISDFYNNRRFDSDLHLSGFEYQDQMIGDISFVNKWDRETELVNGEMTITKNNRAQLKGTGYFDPGKKYLDFTFDLDNQTLVILGTVIRETLTNFHGDGSGKVRVHGTFDKILMDGAIYCRNAGLTIDFTQVSYNLNDSIHFSGDRIVFPNIEISDFAGNKGKFKGTIRHDNFRNMDYDLHVNSNKILALNTTLKHNQQFYGKAFVRGNMDIIGHGSQVKLSGAFTSLPETAVTIVLGDEAEVAKYDFIRFITADKDTVEKPNFVTRQESGGLMIDLLIQATPEAKVQMVYNTQISDMIKAQGEGTLRFQMNPAGNIFLTGDFVLAQGEYLFTLQNVINKRFTVEPGGSITWSGDPMNAVIDLNAIYSLRASLYELMVGSNENVTSSTRVPVECRIILTGDLVNPDISFDILFPGLDTRTRDELQQYFSTQEDLNRQMLSLLVLGKFYTPEYVRGNFDSSSSGLFGNTASDLFSNQLSNWLSQINQDLDIGFNYRPGNQITGDEIELALSTQIFNDRVSINGNIGNNTNPRSMNNSELVGDFEINVKLTRNGKLQLKAYNRSNNNLIYETAPCTQGLGVSYKENYNHIEELWRNFLALFGKKNKTTQ